MSHWAAQLTSSHGLLESSLGVRQSIVPSSMMEAAPARARALANEKRSVRESAYWMEECEKAMPASGPGSQGTKTRALSLPEGATMVTVLMVTPSRSLIV